MNDDRVHVRAVGEPKYLGSFFGKFLLGLVQLIRRLGARVVGSHDVKVGAAHSYLQRGSKRGVVVEIKVYVRRELL